MALNELLPELLKLSHDEKLHAIAVLQQHLQNESVQDDPLLTNLPAGAEIWSPQVAPDIARQLLDMLQEDKETHG